MEGAPEMKNKVTISWYLLFAIIVTCLTMGGTIAEVLNNDHEREEQKEFLLEEIRGLRSDWERQYNQNIDPRLKKLEEKVDQMK